MMKTIVRRALRLLACLSAFTFSNTAWTQGLPDGEGLKVVVVACTQCHALDRLAKLELTAAEWENALYDMMARGAIVEGRDLATVRKYLVENLAVDGKED